MKCPNCDFENEHDATFCNECGSKLEIGCPSCGKTNLPGLVTVKNKRQGFPLSTAPLAAFTLLIETKRIEIGDGRIVIETKDGRSTLQADTVLITSGYVEGNTGTVQLKAKVPELHLVGDARKPESCQQAPGL